MTVPSRSVNEIAPLLREVDFKFEMGSHDPPLAPVVRPLPYHDQWRTIIDKRWYSYKLEDHSLLIFIESTSPSFSFLPCPLEVDTLREFARRRGVAGSEVYSADTVAEYEVYLSTAPLREHVAPVRFDLDSRGFDHDCHPLGHLHIGHDSGMRLGTEREWNPLAFFLFVLRQYYPDKWRVLLRRPSARAVPRRVREGLHLHDSAYLQPIFSRECFLS